MPELTRRVAMLAATATALAGASVRADDHAKTTMTPDEAIAELTAGNGRYVQQRMVSFTEDLAELRAHTAGSQAPFAAVLSCADSRVPVEIIFDQSIGRLFVVRVAGNMATPEAIGSLEYGAAVLGTKAIMVLGHSGCGAVKAAMAGGPVPGQISGLFPFLRAGVEAGHGDLARSIAANAAYQARILATASPVLADLVARKDLAVLAGVYDLGTGVVNRV